MDKKTYIDILKNTNLRPNKIKLETYKPVILNEQENKMGNIHKKIISWFMNNPYPNDKQVHSFAEEIGIAPDEFEGHIYMILSSILSEGKCKNYKGDFDKTQVKKGIDVELEHTTDKTVAEKIAKDHLCEIPDYYDRLEKMEKEAGINEIFIQQGEINSMEPGVERDKQILRLAIIAELDASNLYEQFAQMTDNDDISTVMFDISKEEKTHAGEFQALLNSIDSENQEELEAGEEEIEDLLKKDF